MTVVGYRASSTGGPVATVRALRAELAARGHEVAVFTDAPDAHAPATTTTPMRVGAALASFRPDVVHVHELRNVLGEAAARWAARAGVPLACHPHGGLLGYRQLPTLVQRTPYALYDLVGGRTPVRTAAFFFCTAPIEARDARAAGVADDRLAIVPLGADDAFFDAPRAPRREGFRFLFVGNVGYTRRLDLLLEATRDVRSTHPDARVLLVGGEAKQSLLGGAPPAIRTALHAPELERLGKLGGDALVRAYAEADAFAYPSTHENFALPILEAAATGLPIVTTPVGIAPEVVRDGENGVLVGPLTAGRFADGMRRVMDQRAAFAAAAERARAGLRAEYRWSAVASRIETLYPRLRVLGGRTVLSA